MHIPTLTDDSLKDLHTAIKEALKKDDDTAEGLDKPYGVRQHGDWRRDADAYEAELDRRELLYDKIIWNPR